MPLAPGARFAGYTIVTMLDITGIGEVYLAAHPEFERHDVLKILPMAMTGDREFRARFNRETTLVTTLCHPHILEVHDRGESEGQPWIAMEYVNGTNAAQLIRERFPDGMPPGEALAIIAAIAEALDYAHQRGMLHRDVKPASIVLTDPQGGEQRILLTDFGIARRLGDTTKLTAINLPLAAVAYAAPEQLTGEAFDERADQYGLAATAFHLLTGAPPYEGSDPVAVVSQRLEEARPRLEDRRPDLRRLDGVLSIALAKQPAERFGSCQAFADALCAQAGVSTGDRSPEAVLTFDYPDDATAPADVAVRERPARGARLRLRGGTRGRSWIVLGSATAATLIVGIAALGVGILIGRNSATTSTQASSSSPPAARSTPATAPTSMPAGPPPYLLDGAYSVDINRTLQTYNEAPDPQPPNVTTWWAFRSSCEPSGCVASGTMLDSESHQKASAKAGDQPLFLDFRDGAWQSRPETLRFPCVGLGGNAAEETTTQVLSLRPDSHGALRGVLAVTVQTDECGQKDGRIVIPAVAARIGDVPAGVILPGPSSGTSAPSTTTRTR